MGSFNQTTNCVVALSMMPSIVFGSLLRQAWPPLHYNIFRWIVFRTRATLISIQQHLTKWEQHLTNSEQHLKSLYDFYK